MSYMIAPAKTAITLRFGATTAPYSPAKPHIGTDYNSVPDDGVYMPEDGVVEFGFWDGKPAATTQTREGNVIYFTAGNRRHALCHLSQFLVKDRQYCSQGQKVGIMGSTGFAFGKHLHWAVREGGVYVDGTKFLGGNMTDALTKEEIIIAYAQQYDVTEDKVNMDVVKAFTGHPLGEYLNFVKKDPSYIAHFNEVNSPSDATVLTKGKYAVL